MEELAESTRNRRGIASTGIDFLSNSPSFRTRDILTVYVCEYALQIEISVIQVLYKMIDVVMDTNFWIDLKDPEYLKKFKETKETYEFRLNFTRANFIDLANADDQDRLSKVLPQVVDRYVAIEDFNDDKYHHSNSPLLLLPPSNRESVRDLVQDLDVDEILKIMFRIYKQVPDSKYPDISEAMRDLYRNHGEDSLEMAAFWRYVENTGDGGGRLDFTNPTHLSYIYRKLRTEHAKQLQPNENVEFQDRLDIKICTYGVVVGDILIIEGKWVNQNIIPAAFEEIEGEKPPLLATSFDEFSEVLSEESHGA